DAHVSSKPPGGAETRFQGVKSGIDRNRKPNPFRESLTSDPHTPLSPATLGPRQGSNGARFRHPDLRPPVGGAKVAPACAKSRPAHADPLCRSAHPLQTQKIF